jgi:hypothetical protein
MICAWCGEPVEGHRPDQAAGCLAALSVFVLGEKPVEKVDGPTLRLILGGPG